MGFNFVLEPFVLRPRNLKCNFFITVLKNMSKDVFHITVAQPDLLSKQQKRLNLFGKTTNNYGLDFIATPYLPFFSIF